MQAGLESIIRTNPTLQVIGRSGNADSLLQRFEELQPDVVLLEWLNDQEEPIWETLLTKGTGVNSPALVILGDFEDNDGVRRALLGGVRSVLPRSAATEEIVAAVLAVATGLVVLHPDLMEDWLPHTESTARALPMPIQALTPREIEVLRMLALGLGNKSIASRLSISEHTVKFHVSSIFTKLNARTRTEAVTLGARLGLIML